MGTMFHHEDGAHVATRWWGGEERGVVVQLERGAGDVMMDTPLQGDDGSSATLRDLADQAGSNSRMSRELFGDLRCERCGEADRTLGEHGLGRCVSM
jgi:hypothetical protein